MKNFSGHSFGELSKNINSLNSIREKGINVGKKVAEFSEKFAKACRRFC